MRVAVAGATGAVGRHVVAVAERRGHQVVGLCRAAGVDLTSGEGLAERIEGAEAVVDVSGTRTQRRGRARELFGAVTDHLLDAGAAAGVGHHVALSIVGLDRIHTGYHAGKVHQEHLVSTGPLQWTILRATQCHELAEQALGFATVGPLSVVPRMRVRPVAAREVAEALVGLVESGPCGRAAELAGPAEHKLVDLARRVTRARGLGRRVVGIPLPGAAGRAMRTGALLPADGLRGVVTFEQWLAQDG